MLRQRIAQVESESAFPANDGQPSNALLAQPLRARQVALEHEPSVVEGRVRQRRVLSGALDVQEECRRVAQTGEPLTLQEMLPGFAEQWRAMVEGNAR